MPCYREWHKIMLVITFPDYCSLSRYNHLCKHLQILSMQPPLCCPNQWQLIQWSINKVIIWRGFLYILQNLHWRISTQWNKITYLRWAVEVLIYTSCLEIMTELANHRRIIPRALLYSCSPVQLPENMQSDHHCKSSAANSKHIHTAK